MASSAKAKVVYEWGDAGATRNIRDDYVRSLRPGDEAWVPRLDVLVLPRNARGKGRPSVDLASVIAAILGTGAIIVDGATGVTSRDGDAWKDRVEWAMRKVSSGSPSPAQAKKRGRMGAAVIKASAVALKWKSPTMAAERDRWGPVWRDPKYKTWQEAADALPAPLTGRKWLAYKIFGPRQPDNPKAGGRPPKSKATR